MTNDKMTVEKREKIIVGTSLVGIFTNLLLAASKAVVGLLANSIAVILDAVNNLSDALSSLITIIGTKLSAKAPDRKHPYGYGRIEYMTQMIVSAIVLYAGFTSCIESIKKIINPKAAEYSPLSLAIIAGAVIVKIFLGLFVRGRGKKVNSGALVASGADALSDAVLSLSVLASAAIFMFFGLSLEAWVGIAISFFIIKSGLEMIKEAVDEILGSRVSGDLSKKIKGIVAAHKEVLGVYDLFMNNFGPDRYIASLHVEVRDTMTAAEFDTLSRELYTEVYSQTQVVLVSIGLYSANLGDDEAGRIRADVRNRVMSHDKVLQMHGFYLDMQKMIMNFDVIIDFIVPDRAKLLDEIRQEIAAAYPNYQIRANLDIDASD